MAGVGLGGWAGLRGAGRAGSGGIVQVGLDGTVGAAFGWRSGVEGWGVTYVPVECAASVGAHHRRPVTPHLVHLAFACPGRLDSVFESYLLVLPFLRLRTKLHPGFVGFGQNSARTGSVHEEVKEESQAHAASSAHLTTPNNNLSCHNLLTPPCPGHPAPLGPAQLPPYTPVPARTPCITEAPAAQRRKGRGARACSAARGGAPFRQVRLWGWSDGI